MYTVIKSKKTNELTFQKRCIQFIKSGSKIKNISNKCCAFKISIHQRVLKNNILKYIKTVILIYNNISQY